MIANDKNGISSWEFHRALGITQKSEWFLLHRIRMAMQTGTFEKLSSQIKADETFVGGKARNVHKGKRQAQGKEIPMQSYFRDYREVGGMKFAFAIDSGSSASDLTQKIIIEKIELNPQVPESEFAKPAAPGETATPAASTH